MAQGTIKKLIVDKGFGFITGDTGDLFFHVTSLENLTMEELSVGQVVNFTVGHSDKGPRAENIYVE